MDVRQIQLAQAGNQSAFQELMEDWYERIYGFAFRYFGNHDQASEVSQKTFIQVYQKLDSLKEPQKFRAWLYQIAGNYCREEFRRSKRQRWITWTQATAPDTDHPNEERPYRAENQFDPEKDYEDQERSALVQEALTQIKAEQRIVIIMKEFEGLRFREIAEILELSENTVKSRLYYGLKHLKKVFEKWNINEETINYEK